MGSVRVAATVEQYIAAVHALGENGNGVPVLGDRATVARLLAHVDAAATIENAATADGPASDPQRAASWAYAVAMHGSRPDDDKLVVGIGADAPAAACHAALKGAQLLLADDLDGVEAAVRGVDRRVSVTLVGGPGQFGPAALCRLRPLLTGRGVPWGVLTGRDTAGVTWSVLKQRLALDRRSGRHLLLHSAGNARAPAGRVGLLSALYGAEITGDVLRRLTEVPHDLVAFTGHGDQADAYTHGGWLCARTQDHYDDLLASTRGFGLMRCFAEPGCYRSSASAAVDGVPADRKVLVPADRVLATVLLLNSCASLLAAPGYRYGLESSLLHACLEGTATAVVAVETPRLTDPAEALLFSGLISTGSSLGEATSQLNQAQQTYFSGAPVFVLFGDPDLRLADPGASVTGSSVHPVRLPPDPAGGGTCVEAPVPAGHAVRIRLPDRAAVRRALAGPRPRAEVLDADPHARAFVLPDSAGSALLVVTERRPFHRPPVVRLLAGDEPAPAVDGLRALQRRLDGLGMVSCPADDAAARRLRGSIAAALRVRWLPPAGGDKTAAERAALSSLRRELLLFQSRAVQGWVTAWNDAQTGEMIALREDRALYGPYVAPDSVGTASSTCPNCAAPLYRVDAHDLHLPDVTRRLWICPSCTVVADLPAGSTMLGVDAADAAVRGRPYEIMVELPVKEHWPGVCAVGAAILGARGRCRPAVVPGPDGRGGPVTLPLFIGMDMVPGSYSLRVVVMTDLECWFHLRPVSVTLSAEPASADHRR